MSRQGAFPSTADLLRALPLVHGILYMLSLVLCVQNECVHVVLCDGRSAAITLPDVVIGRISNKLTYRNPDLWS